VRFDQRVLAADARGFGEIVVVAVDIPIGLPDTGARQADAMARRLVGPRSSSVFSTPTRGAIEIDDYERTSEIQQRNGGKGLTRQAFGLRVKIREVEDWPPIARTRVVEVHPEVSFAELAQEPLLYSKTTWAGVEQRRRLLEAARIALPLDLGAAGARAGVDDLLDAAAAAWTAVRVRDESARQLPNPPEVFSDGIAAAIWY
jgi:predicted RNase H-like nuclease